MDFSFTPEQQAIRSTIEKICARFGDDYWLAKDRDGGFPHDFHCAFAADGWLGIAMPQAYGGAGRRAVDSNELFIESLPVPTADRIGEEGKGFAYILHGLNVERILIAAEAIGLGRAALRKAAS